MTYETIPSRGFSGYGAFGSAAGDALGEGCLCGGAGVCTTASKQGPAMATLRAAMREAGLPTASGNWTTGEQNTLNNFARSKGFAASSKFLVDGGPCQALKQALSAPAAPPPGAAPPASCAELLALAPPVPPGTPVASVIAVLQQIAPPGFDVASCMAGSTPTPGPGPRPADVIPPTGVSVTTETSDGPPALAIVAIGLAAVLGLGGIAYVATRPSMKKNGRRRRR